MATGDGDNLNSETSIFKLSTGQPTPPNVYYVPLFKNSGLGNLGLFAIHWFSLIRLIKLLNPYFWGGVRYGGVGWLAIFSSVWTSELIHEKKWYMKSTRLFHCRENATPLQKKHTPASSKWHCDHPNGGHQQPLKRSRITTPKRVTRKNRSTQQQTQTQWFFVGFFRGEYSRGGGNWGTLRIPREDWGTLGKIRGITTPPFKNPSNSLRYRKKCSKKSPPPPRPLSTASIFQPLKKLNGRRRNPFQSSWVVKNEDLYDTGIWFFSLYIIGKLIIPYIFTLNLNKQPGASLFFIAPSHLWGNLLIGKMHFCIRLKWWKQHLQNLQAFLETGKPLRQLRRWNPWTPKGTNGRIPPLVRIWNTSECW